MPTKQKIKAKRIASLDFMPHLTNESTGLTGTQFLPISRCMAEFYLKLGNHKGQVVSNNFACSPRGNKCNLRKHFMRCKHFPSAPFFHQRAFILHAKTFTL